MDSVEEEHDAVGRLWGVGDAATSLAEDGVNTNLQKHKRLQLDVCQACVQEKDIEAEVARKGPLAPSSSAASCQRCVRYEHV